MKRHYNIAIVSGCLSSRGGGAPRSVSQQARALQQAGCHVKIFCGSNRDLPLTIDEFHMQNISVVSSKLHGPAVLGFFPKALAQLYDQANLFDFIHLNGAWNLTTFIAALIARKHKVPYIISCRGHFGEYHFRRKAWLKPILFGLMEKVNIRHAAALHMTADWEIKTSARAVTLAQNIIKIPNPVDLSDFRQPPTQGKARKELHLNAENFHVVHLGRVAAQKNLIFLVKSFNEANLGNQATLTFIGPEERKTASDLRLYIKNHNLGQRVRFVNFAEKRERCLWLSSADLFALPSFDENFCIVEVEAAACGTPCLVSPFVGATEYLPQHLVTVIPLDKGKWIAELQAAQKRVKTMRTQYDSGNAISDRFSFKTISHEWLRFYEEMQ